MKRWKPTIKEVLWVAVATLGVAAMAHDFGNHIAEEKHEPTVEIIEAVTETEHDARAEMILEAEPLPTESIPTKLTEIYPYEPTEPSEPTEPEIPAPTEGQALYDVPMPDDLQIFIIDLCEEKHIDPRIIFAMIKMESNYEPDALGDNGNSHGLMQIQPRWHQGLMTRLGCYDLLDPYQNVTVGVELLSLLLEKYGTMGEALTAYNAGDYGAWNRYFSKGVYASDYALSVMYSAETID